MKKDERLKGGVAVLFGGAPATPATGKEETKSSEELLETVKDQELKEKLRLR